MPLTIRRPPRFVLDLRRPEPVWPAAETIVLVGKEHWRLLVKCPLCGEVHEHGGGPITEPPQLGSKVAHCRQRTAPFGYVCVPVGQGA